MAYILKSNVEINDPENLLPYYTQFGITPSAAKIYFDDLQREGFSINNDHAVAVITFVKSLEDGGVWSKVRECYPFMGNNFGSVSTKLKSISTLRKMSALGGLSFSDFETVNGVSLGKNQTGFLFNNSKRFNTGVKISDLNDNFALHAYLGAVPELTATDNQALWGASQIADASRATVAQFLNNGSSTQIVRLSNQSFRFEKNGFSSVGPFIYQAVANGSDASIYFNGVLEASGQFPSRASGSLPTDRDLHLFGQNGFGVNENTTGHYAGKVRFFMLTRGDLTSAERDIIRASINALMLSLGRGF